MGMAEMKIDFTGRTALVTGGTRGIGRQLVEDLLELGAQVIATGTTDTFPAELQGERLSYMQVDFSDRDDTEKFTEELGHLERIDVCVNNAGINRINPIDETLVGDWDAISAVNLDAPFLVTRAVSKIMKRQQYGRIVNIASIFGVISKPQRALYSMTKFGLRGLTVSSSLDLAAHNVLVNTVSPGFVVTELTTRILGEEEMARLAGEVPLQRFAQPTEISKTVLFLASELNSYITGQNLIVDGGFVNV